MQYSGTLIRLKIMNSESKKPFAFVSTLFFLLLFPPSMVPICCNAINKCFFKNVDKMPLIAPGAKLSTLSTPILGKQNDVEKDFYINLESYQGLGVALEPESVRV